MRNYFDSGLQERPTSCGSVRTRQESPAAQHFRAAPTNEVRMASQSHRQQTPDYRPHHVIPSNHSDRRPSLVAPTHEVGSVATVPQSAAVAPPGETPAPVKAKKKRIRIKTEPRREQCRLNQQRYRNKQRSFAVNLEDTVKHLRQDVLQLEAQRRSLFFCVNIRESATRTVVEYFRFFGGGLTIHELRPDSGRPSVEQQILFVTSAFQHDIRVGDDYGAEFFLEQWRRFSTFYDGVRVIPQRFIPQCDPEVSTIVEVKVDLLVTITPTTIRQLYPHLQQSRYNEITWKMLGQRINFRSGLEFVFDEDGKVQSVEWTIDFVEGLRPFLTIEETAHVLQQALVVRDAYLLQREEDDGALTEEFRANQPVVNDPWQLSSSNEGEIQPWQYSALGQSDDEGYLIHDGQGDDYVMV